MPRFAVYASFVVDIFIFRPTCFRSNYLAHLRDIPGPTLSAIVFTLLLASAPLHSRPHSSVDRFPRTSRFSYDFPFSCLYPRPCACCGGLGRFSLDTTNDPKLDSPCPCREPRFHESQRDPFPLYSSFPLASLGIELLACSRPGLPALSFVFVVARLPLADLSVLYRLFASVPRVRRRNLIARYWLYS